MKQKKRIAAGVSAVLLLALAFAGWRGIWLPGQDLSAGMERERGRKFGATYMTMNNPFFEIIDDEIRNILESRGDILITRDPALSVEKQMDQVQEMIDRRVDAIFINPVDWKAIEPALSKAAQAGIPVIAVDSDVYDSGKVACTIVSDNYQAGELCAGHLLDNREGGRILLLTHTAAKSGIDRIQGFRDALKGYEDFTILAEGDCQGQLELAMPVTERLLKEYPQADVVMCLNDLGALGAMAALEDSGLGGKVAVYGVDGSPDGKSMIAERIMTATAAQFPKKLGREAVNAAYRILAGEEVEPVIKIPTELITIENLDQYDVDGWQ